MIKLNTTALALILAMTQVYHSYAADTVQDYFVFLVTGKSTSGVPAEEIKSKQAAHLENFGRLAKLGSLTAAGPCADPDKVIRGIVVVHADSIAKAESFFAPDPYVSEQFMRTEIHGFKTVAGKLQLVTEVTSMEQSVIVTISQGSKWPTEPSAKLSSVTTLTTLAKEQFESKKLAFAGIFNEQNNNSANRVAVLIFHGKDVDAIKTMFNSHELIKQEVLRFQAFPQYLAKGAIGD